MSAADLDLMARDAARMRGVKPVVFSNMRDGTGPRGDRRPFCSMPAAFRTGRRPFAEELPPLTEWSRGVAR